jgi:hypothetical protein
MIKRIWFGSRSAGSSIAEFSAAWRDAVAGAARAPADARPLRIAAGTVLPELCGPEPRHDGTGIAWFSEPDQLRRFEDWRGPADGPVLLAEEAVLRGGDWLAGRCGRGEVSLKHLALARRADPLTPAEFSARWRDHAGRAGGTAIPEDVRGRAYVQNHPCPRVGGEWAYDAVNEVYFERGDAAGLRRRIAWFRGNGSGNAGGRSASELFGQSWFLAVQEEVVHGTA